MNSWKTCLDNYETSWTKDLDDDERKRVLESAIRPKPELHACTANGELLSTLLSSLGVAADDLTFEPFLTMVMAHGKTLDKQNAAKKPPTRKNNKANQRNNKNNNNNNNNNNQNNRNNQSGNNRNNNHDQNGSPEQLCFQNGAPEFKPKLFYLWKKL